MQSSGYFFAGSKSAGLIKTPSIVVPSWLCQEIISRVPSVKDFVCSFRLVNLRGAKLCASETNTSFMLVGEATVKAIRSALCVNENEPVIRLSGCETRTTFALTGSTRNKCEAVFSNPRSEEHT